MLVSLVAVAVIGCKKKDQDAPIISLQGSSEETVSLNTTYTESGAIAKDDNDGDISSNILISGNVNTNLTGVYQKFYDVEDEAGNNATRVTRNITVVNDADFLTGSYIATTNGGGSSYFTAVTASTTQNNNFNLSQVLNETNVKSSLVDGNILDIPFTVISTGNYQGTGSTLQNSFVINWEEAYQGNPYSITINHVKQ